MFLAHLVAVGADDGVVFIPVSDFAALAFDTFQFGVGGVERIARSADLHAVIGDRFLFGSRLGSRLVFVLGRILRSSRFEVFFLGRLHFLHLLTVGISGEGIDERHRHLIHRGVRIEVPFFFGIGDEAHLEEDRRTGGLE